MFIARWMTNSHDRRFDLYTLGESREAAVAAITRLEPNLVHVETSLAAGPNDGGRYLWTGRDRKVHHLVQDCVYANGHSANDEIVRRQRILDRRVWDSEAKVAPRFAVGDVVQFNQDRTYYNWHPSPNFVYVVKEIIQVPEYLYWHVRHTQLIKLAEHWNDRTSGYYLNKIETPA